MPVYQISSLTAVLIQAPACATVSFERGLKDYLARTEVYQGICRAVEPRPRQPIYLAELSGMSHDRFLLSLDGRTFLRPRVLSADAREEPRGPVVGPEGRFFQILGKFLPINGAAPSKHPERNDGYQLGLFDGSRIVLTFERGEPRLWRSVHGDVHPFDSELYYPGRAPADTLLASGFSAFARTEASEMMTATSARFLR